MAAHGNNLVKAHLCAHIGLYSLDLGRVAVEQLHKAGLGAGGALYAAQSQIGDLVIDLAQIHIQFIHPQRSALANGGQLSGLQVGIGQSGHILVLLGKIGQQSQHANQLFAHQLQAFAHNDHIGIIAHIAAGGTQMNDAGCLGALQAIGVHMAHHIVANQFFTGNGILVVDVVLVGFQLGDLFIGDAKALLLLGLSQSDPQAAPCAELVVFAENILHFVRRIAGRKRTDIAVMLCH